MRENSFVIDYTKKKTPKDKPRQLRPHQVEDYTLNAHRLLSLSNFATGSGKSLMGMAKGSYWVKRGYRLVVAVPQDIILRSFKEPKWFDLPDGDKLEWPALGQYAGRASDLVEWVNSDEPGIVLVTHALLVAAHKRGARWSNVCLVVDEAHRAAYSECLESNKLGEVFCYFVERGLPLHLLSASFWREDNRKILPERYSQLLAEGTYEFPIEEQMAGMKLTIKYIQGPIEKTLKYVLKKGKKPVIVWIPHTNSAAMQLFGFSGKDEAAALVRKLAPDHVDLVTTLGRDKVKEELHEALLAGKGPDTTICLAIGFEGYDDPRLACGVLMGSRGSIRQTCQALGRLLRRLKGKREVEFITLIPDFGELDVESVTTHIKQLIAGMVIQWYLQPATAPQVLKSENPISQAELVRAITRANFAEGPEAAFALALKACGGDEEKANDLMMRIEKRIAEVRKRTRTVSDEPRGDSMPSVKKMYKEYIDSIKGIDVKMRRYPNMLWLYAHLCGDKLAEIRKELQESYYLTEEEERQILAHIKKHANANRAVNINAICRVVGRDNSCVTRIALANGYTPSRRRGIYSLQEVDEALLAFRRSHGRCATELDLIEVPGHGVFKGYNIGRLLGVCLSDRHKRLGLKIKASETTIEQRYAWYQAHYIDHGKWPTQASGLVGAKDSGDLQYHSLQKHLRDKLGTSLAQELQELGCHRAGGKYGARGVVRTNSGRYGARVNGCHLGSFSTVYEASAAHEAARAAYEKNPKLTKEQLKEIACKAAAKVATAKPKTVGVRTKVRSRPARAARVAKRQKVKRTKH